MQHRKEMEKPRHSFPKWIKECEVFKNKRGTPLLIRRKLAGSHQVQTRSRYVSTTSERMQLFWNITILANNAIK